MVLEPKQMSRAVIVGHKNVLEETVDALHGTNQFHIEDFIEDESDLKIGRPFENADEISKKLVKLRSISSFLGIKEKLAAKQSSKALMSSLDADLDKLDREVSEKTERKGELDAKLKEIESIKKELEPLSAIPLDLDLYRDYENLAVFVGKIKLDVEPEISKITSSYELFTDQKSSTIALFVTKEDAEKVSAVLSENGFREIRVPQVSGSPKEILAKAEQDEKSLQKQIESISTDIESIKSKYADFILASDELLSIETQKAEAPLRIATSENTFMIDGWVPTDDFDKLARTIESATNGRAFVSKEEVTTKEENDTPVEYNNSNVVKPLEEIMNLYARPKYKEIDPTSLIFITFPLFYGMILGDIGYALILAAFAIAIKKFVKSAVVAPLMNILIYCQISTLIFGVLYGEFLGFPLAGLESHGHYEPGLLPGFETINLLASPIGGEMVTFPLHRTHMVMTFVVATALIGVIHINIGYILGFINENRKHGFAAAMFEKGSWIVVEIAIVLLALGYIGYLPIAIGAAVFVIGFIMLVKGEGIKGPIELPSILSNALSYTRLIAVGLSSIGIASTVNLIAFEMLMPKGGVLIIFAILVFIFGHALNTVLSIIAPGLHALRLQYVEFFTKFYEGGGREYDPFGYIRKYTEE